MSNQASFPTDWDVEEYRQPFESDDQWELRSEFMLAHKEEIPEHRLVCLAQVFANIEILSSRYPDEVMEEVKRLSEGLECAYSIRKAEQQRVAFVKAAEEKANPKPKDPEYPPAKQGRWERPAQSNQPNNRMAASSYFQTASTATEPPQSYATGNKYATQNYYSSGRGGSAGAGYGGGNYQSGYTNAGQQGGGWAARPDQRTGQGKVKLEMDAPLVALQSKMNALAAVSQEPRPQVHFRSWLNMCLERVNTKLEKIVEPADDGKWRCQLKADGVRLASALNATPKEAISGAISTAVKLLSTSGGVTVIRDPAGQPVLSGADAAAVVGRASPPPTTSLQSVPVASLKTLPRMNEKKGTKKKKAEVPMSRSAKRKAKATKMAAAAFNQACPPKVARKNEAEMLVSRNAAKMTEVAAKMTEVAAKMTEVAVKMTEVAATVPVPEPEARKRKPKVPDEFFRDFVLVYRQSKNRGQDDSPLSLLGASAPFNKRRLDYLIDDTDGSMFRCLVQLDGVTVGEGEAAEKKAAKRAAATVAVDHMRKVCQTLVVNANASTDGHVSKDELGLDQRDDDMRMGMVTGVIDEDTAIPYNNVGNKLLRMMGWSGGGLGKEGDGISEPIRAVKTIRRQGLGLNDKSCVSNAKPDAAFMKSIRQLMQDYASSESTDDLLFASEFSKEERAQMHIIARRFKLKTRSQGKEPNRYLVVSQKFDRNRLLQAIQEQGGQTKKYQLQDPTQT